MTEVYVSTDIETNGPCPALNSMLSFGSVALMIDGSSIKKIGDYYANLDLLDGATSDPSTMKFWSNNQNAYNQTRVNPRPSEDVFPEYAAWLKALPGRPVFVGYPAGFDFTFIYYYLHRFAGESPFSFSALDIKSYVMAVLKTDFRESTKRNMPKRWFPKLPHTHNALDDALEQGHLFCNILLEHTNAKPR